MERPLRERNPHMDTHLLLCSLLSSHTHVLSCILLSRLPTHAPHPTSVSLPCAPCVRVPCACSGLRDAFLARRTARALREAKREHAKPKTAAQRAAEIAALADATASGAQSGAEPGAPSREPKEELDAAERMHRR
jgi:hypothetical protein